MKQSLKDHWVVALIGVLVTVGTLFWTVLSSQRDNHRAEVEFKNELVAQIAEPTSDALVTGRRIVGLPNAPEPSGGKVQTARAQTAAYAEFIRVRKLWTETRYEIGGKLAAAFSKDIVGEWDHFSGAVEDYLRLSSSGNTLSSRRGAAQRLTAYLGGFDPPFSIPARLSARGFVDDYFRATDLLGKKLKELTSDLNEAEARQFGFCFWCG
jgi:hypothetical protein